MVYFYPGTFGKKENENLGKGDISLDVYGWRAASQSFQLIYKDEVAKGIVPRGTPLVCTYWWGAHVEYYFARPLNIPMIGLGSLSQIRHYLWMNNLRTHDPQPRIAYCIMPVDEQYDLPSAFYTNVQMIATIEVNRMAQPAHNFRVYRLTGWKNNIPTDPFKK